MPERLGAIIVEPTSNCFVSATFFLKWIDVFGIECDASGSFLVEETERTKPNDNGIIGSAEARVSTDVYDTSAWFKRWEEKNRKNGK